MGKVCIISTEILRVQLNSENVRMLLMVFGNDER